MTRINYITNEALDVTSGGWSGINFHVYSQLSKYFETNYVGPIKPGVLKTEKLLSKLKRLSGRRGNFYFFSKKRLARIDEDVRGSLKSAGFNFFFGQTPWIHCRYDMPYGVYIDADFRTYLEIFAEPEKFSSDDIHRIVMTEKEWLSNAKLIFWGSTWAYQMAMERYQLTRPVSRIVKVGGNIQIPESDRFVPGDSPIFTFISLNFKRKGGFECVEAFNIIRGEYPTSRLIIIGEEPPPDILSCPGVSHAGLLRKTVPEEYEQFRSIVEKSWFLIHPTTMDTMGAVIVESAYFGCPSIAPRRFGIPDLIIEGKTGLLVDVPFKPEDFAYKVISLLRNPDEYLCMRKLARENALSELTWDAIGLKMAEEIRKFAYENTGH